MKPSKLKMPTFKKPSLSGRGTASSAKPSSTRSSSIKPPKVVSDLFADLRDRHLLPLIALLIVAIVAVPILLADNGAESPQAPPPPTSSGLTQTAATFSVVPAKRELREFHKRLAHRKPTNPFAPQLSKPVKEVVEKALEGEGEGEGGGGVEESTTTTTTESGGTTIVEAPVVNATVQVNVGTAAIVKAGYVGSKGPGLQQMSLEPQTKLPNPKKPPILVYTGPTKDGTGALFLMSTEVTAFYGKGRCVLGPEPCQVLELVPGKSATFAIGYGETRYKVTLVGFQAIVKEETIHRGG